MNGEIVINNILPTIIQRKALQTYPKFAGKQHTNNTLRVFKLIRSLKLS